jgi:hypothetical protein
MKRKTQQLEQKNPNQKEKYSKILKLPMKYDKRWRLNFVYKPNKLNVNTYDYTGTFCHFYFI